MTQIKQFLLAALVGLAACSAVAQSADLKAKLRALKPDNFPGRPIELAVGAPAGGGLDITARLVARKFQEYSGETMVVNNRAGAGGLIFNRWMATQAAADGYSIGLGMNTVIGDTFLRADGKWSYRDTEPLAFVSFEPIVWLTSTSGRFKGQSLEDILKAVRGKGGDLRVATVSSTPIDYLAEQIERIHGSSFTRVPYNGGKPALLALMGDHIDLSFGFFGEFKGQSDKVKPIAVASARPVAYLPGVPTFNEVLKSNEVSWMVWKYIVAPKGVEPNRKAWLVAVFNAVLADPELIEELTSHGGTLEPALDTPAKVAAELERMAQAERKFYVQTGRIKP